MPMYFHVFPSESMYFRDIDLRSRFLFAGEQSEPAGRGRRDQRKKECPAESASKRVGGLSSFLER